MTSYPLAERGDPSSVSQKFVSVPLKVWCCRFWQFQKWNCQNMSFPYWKIYWNANEGGVIGYNNREFQMSPECVYIIPPNPPFYFFFEKTKDRNSDYEVVGKRIDKDENEETVGQYSLLHLYIHFKLGMPYDFVHPNIYEMKMKRFQVKRIRQIATLAKENNSFSVGMSMEIQSVVFKILSTLNTSIWNDMKVDYRVMKTIDYIDSHIKEKISNIFLAQLVNMATNSFARLFKEETGKSLQQFIKERKINTACGMFDHSDMTIQEVAERLGFADRYHFSRIFKQIKGISPGKYHQRR